MLNEIGHNVLNALSALNHFHPLAWIMGGLVVMELIGLWWLVG